MANEKRILYEVGRFWVYDTGTRYVVYKSGPTVSLSDSAYAHSPDGLSIAIARCNYLHRRLTACPEPCYKGGR